MCNFQQYIVQRHPIILLPQSYLCKSSFLISMHSIEMSWHRTGAGLRLDPVQLSQNRVFDVFFQIIRLLLQVHSGKCSGATYLGREKTISPLLLGRTVNPFVTEYLTLSSHWIIFFHIFSKPRTGNKVEIKSYH